MSGRMNAAQIWNVVSNTVTNLLSPDDGNKIQNYILPKSSDAAVNKAMIVSAKTGDDVTLGFLDTATLVGPQGAQGIQGIQGPQGIQGVAGVNGNNGLGLTYVGSTVPPTPVDGQTWLEQSTLYGMPFFRLWQRRNNRWLDIQIQRSSFNFQAITVNSTFVIPCCAFINNGGFGAILREAQIWTRQTGTANGTNYWRAVVTLKVFSGGLLTTVSIATVNMTNSASDGFAYDLLAGGSADWVCNANSWFEISLERIGTPGSLRGHGFIGANFIR